MAHKKFITIALSIAIVHFILTSAVSHYIAVQVGSQIGHIVAAGLIEAGEKKTGNAEEAERLIN